MGKLWPTFQFSGRTPLAETLLLNDVELDQKLAEALRTGYAYTDELTPADPIHEPRAVDSAIFYSLLRLNTVAIRDIDANAIQRAATATLSRHLLGRRRPLSKAKLDSLRGNGFLINVLNRAVAHRAERHTLGVHDFLAALIDMSITHGDNYRVRPLTADLLMAYAGKQTHDALRHATARKTSA